MTNPTSTPWSQLQFSNSLQKNFSVDQGHPQVSRPVQQHLLARAETENFPQPELLIASPSAAQLLDLVPPKVSADLAGENNFKLSHEWAQIFSGQNILPGMSLVSTRYGGHQFGHWADQLGDGRAILLGEVTNQRGERWEIQLKGAGRTPFSRHADGYAVLRSSLREFLCSEAVHELGIPTTRALCCVKTGHAVTRDMFYDGHPADEPGAITTRLSPSFLRLGHFEILAAHEETLLLRQLVDFSLKNYFPNISKDDPDHLVSLFKEVAGRTAKLMVHWSRVGFVHGVMNTDNMSLLGLTIDYGPYGWLDNFDLDWTPNTTDRERRRYRFSQQPAIALWNLARWAESLLPLMVTESGISATDTAALNALTKKFETGLEIFKATFEKKHHEMRLAKLGFFAHESSPAHEQLISDLDQWMMSSEVDYTIFYRLLSPSQSDKAQTAADFVESFYLPLASTDPVWQKLDLWLSQYRELMSGATSAGASQSGASASANVSQRQELMNKTNPYFILRNYIVQQVLDGDVSLQDVFTALQTPYEENAFTKKFFQRRPDWARTKAGCSMLSCSS